MLQVFSPIFYVCLSYFPSLFAYFPDLLANVQGLLGNFPDSLTNDPGMFGQCSRDVCPIFQVCSECYRFVVLLSKFVGLYSGFDCPIFQLC